MKTGLIQINVTDLEVARNFYLDTLGMRERENGFGPGRPVMIENEGGPMILLYQVEKRVEVDYPDQTGVTLVFHVDDIDETVRSWREKGVTFHPVPWSEEESGIGPCPFGRFIGFEDPSGNVHEILQPK